MRAENPSGQLVTRREALTAGGFSWARALRNGSRVASGFDDLPLTPTLVPERGSFLLGRAVVAGYFGPLGRRPGTWPDSRACQNFGETFL